MKIKCKWCLSENIIKDGKLRGKQLYHCKDCGRKFSDMDRTSIYDWFIAWNLRHKCNNQFRKNRYTQTKLSDNQIARILSRNYVTVSKWASKKPPKVFEYEFLTYIQKREHGGDILLLLGLSSSNEPMSDFLRDIIIRKPKPKKEITKKELERQARIERQEELRKEKQKDKERAISAPIFDRKNAIESLWTLLDCSPRLLFGLRYSDFEDKKVNDKFEVQYVIQFEKGKKAIHNGFSFFDKGNRTLHISNIKILEIVEWLKTDTANNRQRLGTDYDDSYSDFICVKDNGQFYSPHELKRKLATL